MVTDYISVYVHAEKHTRTIVKYMVTIDQNWSVGIETC